MKIIGADSGDYLAFGQKEVPVIGMYGPVQIEDEKTKTKTTLMQTINYIDLGESELLDTSLISQVKQGKDGISIKLVDKKWAWEQLTKYFDWLPDKWQRKLDEDKLEVKRQKLETLKQRKAYLVVPDDRGLRHWRKMR